MDKGIQIVGDLPFYVALDGTAFTYHKELFKVDEEGKATVVGGCPSRCICRRWTGMVQSCI